MAVESEDLVQVEAAHDLEARAVDEAQSAAVGLEPCRHGRVVQRRVQLVEVQQRDELAPQRAHGLHAQPPLGREHREAVARRWGRELADEAAGTAAARDARGSGVAWSVS